MSMQISQSAMGAGVPYEPLNAQMGAGDMYEPAGQMAHDSMPEMFGQQDQYPSGAAMSTFGGAQAFGGAPPTHGGMNDMETAGFTKGPGETHGGHGGHEEHGGHEHGECIDKETGQAPRRCTDVQTCFCFLVYAILALTLLLVAYQHGNTGRLTHGVDYYGRVCGIDAGVENMPFLYWCRADAPAAALPTSVDLEFPSCVAYCPSDYNPAAPIECKLPIPEVQNVIIPGGQFGNVQTQMIKVEESVVTTVPYPTYPRGGRYCVPVDEKLKNQVLEGGEGWTIFGSAGWGWIPKWNGIALGGYKGLGFWSTNRLLNLVGTLRHLYWLMVVATLLSIGMGYFFIFGVKNCPYQLANIFLLPLALFVAVCAVFFLMAIGCIIDHEGGFCVDWYVNNPVNPLYRSNVSTTVADVTSMVLAVVLAIIAAGVGGSAWNFKSIGISDLMNASFETFKAVPGLYYVPLFEGLAKFVVFWCGMQGFAVIFSEGYVEKNRIHINGGKFAGLSRTFNPAMYDLRFWVMAIVWIFFFHWMLEFVTAMGQFITSYCVFKFYGIKKVKGKKPPLHSHVVLEGLKMGLIYHPGSIFRGALVVPPLRPLRLLNWCTYEISQGSAPTTAGGKAIACLENILTCGCISCFDGCYKYSKNKIESEDFPIKDAFGDVVVRANDFDNASNKAHGLLEHSHKIIQYLYRDLSQTTINLIGVMAISGSVSAGVFLLVSNLDIYKEPTSATYVAEPVVITFLTWVLSAYIAFGFMTLWDHTADSLLYCYAHSRRWNRKTVDQYVPESLRYIVGFDDKDDDRYPYYGKAKNNMYLRYWLPMVGMDDPKKKKAEKDVPVNVMETNSALPAVGMGRRPASQADGSWMSGFGTNFMQRQEQNVGEDNPLL